MTFALEAVPFQRKQALPVSVISSTRSINPERQLPKGNTDKIHKVGCAFGQITNIQNDRRSVQLALKCFW